LILHTLTPYRLQLYSIMPNVKISDLTPTNATPTLASGDLVAVVVDPATTPATKKSTIANLMGQAPVQSVASKTGAVTLSSTDISGLGSAATKSTGTADGNVLAIASGTLDLGANKIEDFKASLPSEITSSTYTVTTADNGKVLRVYNATGCTITVPAGLLGTDSSGFNCSFIQTGPGAITFQDDGTSSINNRQSHTKTAGQWGIASILSTSHNVYVLMGDTAT
jgi:hypothetical protein